MNSLIKISLSTLAFSTLAFSQTTMCFKENHTSLTTAETVKLDGGECNSQYSLKDMKNDGWIVDDIKINNNNYIYILKKGQTQTTTFNGSNNISESELEKRVLAKLQKKQAQEKKEKEIERKIKATLNGKEIYINKCQVCHGEKGLIKPGMSSAIANQTFEEFEGSIDGYRNGSYNLGTAVQMAPYATSISEQDTKDIYNYLQSLK